MGRTQYLLWLSDPEMRSKDKTSVFGLPVLDLPSPMATAGCSSQAQYVTTYGHSCTYIQVPEKHDLFPTLLSIALHIKHTNHKFNICYELIFQLDAIEYLFVYFQLDMFRAYTPTHTPQDRHLTTPRTPYALYVI